ncbi:MAG: PAS domain-containing protein, partial [Sphaerobacteraceae bacterium]
MRLTPSVITQELIEAIPDPVLVVATDDSVLLANQPAVRLCELDDLNVQSLHFAEIVTGNSSSGTSVTVRTCQSGRTIPVSDTLPHVRDPDVVVHVLRPEESPVGASTVLDTLVEGVMVVSADGDILYVNQPGRTMLGCRGGYPQAGVREIITDPAGFDDPESAGAHLLDNLLAGRESTLNEPAIAICESASPVEV